MLIDKIKLENYYNEFGSEAFQTLCETFLEEIDVYTEIFKKSIEENDIKTFQAIAHRAKSGVGFIGLNKWVKILNKYAHCDNDQITLDKAKNVADELIYDLNIVKCEIRELIEVLNKKLNNHG